MVSSQEISQQLPQLGDKLTPFQVEAFAKLALRGLDQEFPNKTSHVMTDAEKKVTPRELHPAFFGCFDWHSSVHGHWMLVRLLKSFPGHPKAGEIRARLANHLTRELLLEEAKYFEEKENKSYERMYGWAWLLRLVAELHTWEDSQGKEWRENLKPLEDRIVALTMEYLPKLSYPIRTGVHPDTGFALGQTLDYARIVGNGELEKLVIERAKVFYQADKNYNDAYEPSGEDFFSTALNEADLMRRVLPQVEFQAWLTEFLPNLRDVDHQRLLQPVVVSDVTDGKLVHLAGLDLSRAWTMQGIASALPLSDQRRAILNQAAAAHAKIGFSYVFSGHYEGEHWLATFAIYALTQVGCEN